MVNRDVRPKPEGQHLKSPELNSNHREHRKMAFARAARTFCAALATFLAVEIGAPMGFMNVVFAQPRATDQQANEERRVTDLNRYFITTVQPAYMVLQRTLLTSSLSNDQHVVSNGAIPANSIQVLIPLRRFLIALVGYGQRLDELNAANVDRPNLRRIINFANASTMSRQTVDIVVQQRAFIDSTQPLGTLYRFISLAQWQAMSRQANILLGRPEATAVTVADVRDLLQFFQDSVTQAVALRAPIPSQAVLDGATTSGQVASSTRPTQSSSPAAPAAPGAGAVATGGITGTTPPTRTTPVVIPFEVPASPAVPPSQPQLPTASVTPTEAAVERDRREEQERRLAVVVRTAQRDAAVTIVDAFIGEVRGSVLSPAQQNNILRSAERLRNQVQALNPGREFIPRDQALITQANNVGDQRSLAGLRQQFRDAVARLRSAPTTPATPTTTVAVTSPTTTSPTPSATTTTTSAVPAESFAYRLTLIPSLLTELELLMNAQVARRGPATAVQKNQARRLYGQLTDRSSATNSLYNQYRNAATDAARTRVQPRLDRAIQDAEQFVQQNQPLIDQLFTQRTERDINSAADENRISRAAASSDPLYNNVMNAFHLLRALPLTRESRMIVRNIMRWLPDVFYLDEIRLPSQTSQSVMLGTGPRIDALNLLITASQALTEREPNLEQAKANFNAARAIIEAEQQRAQTEMGIAQAALQRAITDIDPENVIGTRQLIRQPRRRAAAPQLIATPPQLVLLTRAELQAAQRQHRLLHGTTIYYTRGAVHNGAEDVVARLRLLDRAIGAHINYESGAVNSVRVRLTRTRYSSSVINSVRDSIGRETGYVQALVNAARAYRSATATSTTDLVQQAARRDALVEYAQAAAAYADLQQELRVNISDRNLVFRIARTQITPMPTGRTLTTAQMLSSQGAMERPLDNQHRIIAELINAEYRIGDIVPLGLQIVPTMQTAAVLLELHRGYRGVHGSSQLSAERAEQALASANEANRQNLEQTARQTNNRFLTAGMGAVESAIHTYEARVRTQLTVGAEALTIMDHQRDLARRWVERANQVLQNNNIADPERFMLGNILFNLAKSFTSNSVLALMNENQGQFNRFNAEAQAQIGRVFDSATTVNALVFDYYDGIDLRTVRNPELPGQIAQRGIRLISPALGVLLDERMNVPVGTDPRVQASTVDSVLHTIRRAITSSDANPSVANYREVFLREAEVRAGVHAQGQRLGTGIIALASSIGTQPGAGDPRSAYARILDQQNWGSGQRLVDWRYGRVPLSPEELARGRGGELLAELERQRVVVHDPNTPEILRDVIRNDRINLPLLLGRYATSWLRQEDEGSTSLSPAGEGNGLSHSDYLRTVVMRRITPQRYQVATTLAGLQMLYARADMIQQELIAPVNVDGQLRQVFLLPLDPVRNRGGLITPAHLSVMDPEERARTEAVLRAIRRAIIVYRLLEGYDIDPMEVPGVEGSTAQGIRSEITSTSVDLSRNGRGYVTLVEAIQLAETVLPEIHDIRRRLPPSVVPVPQPVEVPAENTLEAIMERPDADHVRFRVIPRVQPNIDLQRTGYYWYLFEQARHPVTRDYSYYLVDPGTMFESTFRYLGLVARDVTVVDGLRTIGHYPYVVIRTNPDGREIRNSNGTVELSNALLVTELNREGNPISPVIEGQAPTMILNASRMGAALYTIGLRGTTITVTNPGRRDINCAIVPDYSSTSSMQGPRR